LYEKLFKTFRDYRYCCGNWIFFSGCNGATSAKHFTFNNADGRITRYSLTGPKDVKIPETIKGTPVLAIDMNTFKDCKITSITIPASVTSFNDIGNIEETLTSITIGANVLVGGSRSRFIYVYQEYGKQAGTYKKVTDQGYITGYTWEKE